jgi:hypothetical protein
MVHNEARMLPVWLKYYGTQIGERNLIVCDNDSDDRSTEYLGGASRLRLPRDAFDDAKRAKCISHLVSAMLTHYEVVIYVDCDEFIVADPVAYPGGLSQLLENDASDYLTPIGLNVVQLISEESNFDPTRPILGQRKWVRFVTPMCKTVVVRKPITFEPGFHASNARPKINKDLYLFHLKRVDRHWALQRLALTRSMAWATTRYGAHQRVSDEEAEAVFNGHASAPRISADRFDFSDCVREFEERLNHDQEKSIYSVRIHLHPAIHEVPERFFGVF